MFHFLRFTPSVTSAICGIAAESAKGDGMPSLLILIDDTGGGKGRSSHDYPLNSSDIHISVVGAHFVALSAGAVMNLSLCASRRLLLNLAAGAPCGSAFGAVAGTDASTSTGAVAGTSTPAATIAAIIAAAINASSARIFK